MPATPLSTALTEQELDRLQNILEAGAAMDLEAADGYFMALICGPEFVSPTEALQEVLGEEFDFDSDEQATDVLGLLMQHWNWISAELLRCQTEPDVYMPVLMEDDAGLVRGNHWARGFMRGVHARPGTWDDMLHSEQHGGNLIPMLMLVHEHDPDPEMRPPAITDEKREEAIRLMIVGANRCYRHYEPMRRAGLSSHTPLRRQSPKVGRNDPCPCGSGRKYKHCCARTMN